MKPQIYRLLERRNNNCWQSLVLKGRTVLSALFAFVWLGVAPVYASTVYIDR